MADAGGAGSPSTCRRAMLAARPASPQPPNAARSTGRRRPAGGSPSTSCIDRVYPLERSDGPLSTHDELQRGQGNGRVTQKRIVKRAQIESFPKTLFVGATEGLDLALADLVRQRLTGPDNIAIDLVHGFSLGE